MRGFASCLALTVCVALAALSGCDLSPPGGPLCGPGSGAECDDCAGVTCAGECIDPLTDPRHCGGCGKECGGATPYCVGGVCAATCGDGFESCDGRCTSLLTDPKNCGACGNDCGPEGACSDGNCLCGPHTTDCGPYCADTTSDDDNCGGCGHECDTTTSRCRNSVCACLDGFSPCGGGRCTDTHVDPKNCGGCDIRCDADEMCRAGECVCRPGLVRVGNACVDPDSDPTACGETRQVCGGDTPRCQGGVCVAACGEGRVACGNACVDLDEDPLHCGECGRRCGVDKICHDGECRDYEPAFGCASCPCEACDGRESCCVYGGAPICVEADECP